VIFSTMFVGVVPAVASCGGDDSTGGGGGQGGTTIKGVAAGAFGAVAAGGSALQVGGSRRPESGLSGRGNGWVRWWGRLGGLRWIRGNRDAAADAVASDARSGAQDGGRGDAAIHGVAQQAFQVPPSNARKSNR